MGARRSENIDLLGVLFVVFLVLKLCKLIEWSWWWVTSPIWMPIGIALFLFLIVECIKSLSK